MAKIRVSGEFVGLDSVDGKDVLVCLRSFSLYGYDINEGDSVVLDVRDGADVILKDKVWLFPGTVLEGGRFTIADSILGDCFIGADNSYMAIFECVITKSRIVPSRHTNFVDCSVIGCSFTINDFSCNVTRCTFKVCEFKALRDCEGLKMRNAVADAFGGCGL